MTTTYRTTRLVLALIGLTVALLLLGRSPHAHADVEFFDITGKQLQVKVRLPDADTGAVLELPVPQDKFPADSRQLLTTPLSAMFDQYWSGNKDANGQTLRDRSCDQARSKTANTIHSKTGQTAHDITCTLSDTGTLRAAILKGLYFVKDADHPDGDFVDGTRLFLSYYLGGNSVAFSVTTPDVFGIGLPEGADPRFSVSFDSEIFVVVVLPDENLAIPGSCEFKGEPTARVSTHNAHMDSANISGDLVKDVNAILTGVGFDGIFPPAEDALNQATSSQPTPLGSRLGSLSRGCATLAGLGFRRFAATVSADEGIVFRLTHPRYDAPGIAAGGRAGESSQPTFFRPLVHPTQPTVGAGNTLTLEGQYFPINISTALHIDIAPTGYCQRGATQIEWGPAGGATQRQVLAEDGQGNCPHSYDATGLTPSTNYQFRARICDALTCSAWSAFLPAATGPAGADTVSIKLDNGSQIGTASVTSGGTFSTTVTIPAATTAGTHTIHATLDTKQADTTVQVQAAGSVNSATITIVSSQGTPLTSTQTDDSFTLFGTGFTPGTVTVYLESPSGFLVGTATAGADGTFRAQLIVPYSQAGPHTLVAVESTDAGTTRATAAVTFVTPSVVR